MGSGSSSPGSPSMNAKEWLEQMENNFTGDASNFNPGSFDDLHQKPLSVFPKPFSGLKLAFLNKFCNHSQLFSSLVLGGAGTGANSCNFDYRWTGDKNVRPVLSPHFFEIPNLTAETTNCKHGTFMVRLAALFARQTANHFDFYSTGSHKQLPRQRRRRRSRVSAHLPRAQRPKVSYRIHRP